MTNVATLAKQADITLKNGCFFVSGDLDFLNVMSVYQKSIAYFGTQQSIVCDFTELHSSNSAGLGLIVEWIKLAMTQQKKITFINMPECLRTIANVAALTTILAKAEYTHNPGDLISG